MGALSKPLWTTFLWYGYAVSNAAISQPLNRTRSFPYLYGVEGNPNASFPVIDHLAAIHRPGDSNNEAVPDFERPDFLFTDTGTYRIVEFYVHWCDICKNFKPHYIELGRRVQQLAGDAVTIDVHAVSCAPNRPLCKELAIDSYPYFRVFVPGDAQGVDVPHAQVNPATILHKMAIAVDENELGNKDEDWNVNEPSSPSVTSWWSRFASESHTVTLNKYSYKRSRDELRDDVHASFDYAMRQGVFVSNDPLSAERAEILFDWLLLLRTTLPVSWTRLHHAVQGLIDNFDYVKRSEDYMVAILDEFPPLPGVDTWSVACSHGQADAGYSCGLWQLFHVVTVGVVDYNRAVAFRDHALRTQVVARTLRDYIEAFFGCETCRRNFVAAFDACALQRCQRLLEQETGNEADWIQLPLWLFETHNAVNLRLQVEKATREHRPVPTLAEQRLVVWPPASDCPSCWHTKGNQTWNNSAVYQYLKIEYGQRDAVSVEFKRELASFQDVVVEPAPNPVKSMWNWPQSLAMMPESSSKSPWMWLVTYFSANAKKRQRAPIEMHWNVHFALDCMLRNGVYQGANDPIDSTRRSALKDWLVLLDQTLPNAWKPLHSLLGELLDNLSFVSASKDYLVAVLDDYPVDNVPDDMTCSTMGSGGNETWDVLYSVAVGTSWFNQHTTSSQQLATQDVAETIRNVVSYFLDCDICNVVMSESLARCAYGLCGDHAVGSETWTNLAMWLVTTHNTVLNRLLRSGSKVRGDVDDLVKGDVYWPSDEACAECWTPDKQNVRDATLAFLQQEYGAQTVTGAEDLQEL